MGIDVISLAEEMLKRKSAHQSTPLLIAYRNANGIVLEINPNISVWDQLLVLAEVNVAVRSYEKDLANKLLPDFVQALRKLT